MKFQTVGLCDKYKGSIQVAFAGVNFVPGHCLYCDIDGIVVSETPLK